MPLGRSALIAAGLLAAAVNLPAGPVIYPGGVVNGAGFLPPPLPGSAIAPGSVCSIFGTQLGPEPGAAASRHPLPTRLAGVSVLVWDSEGTARPARLLYSGPSQVNAVMPEDLPAGLHFVTVTVGDETSSPEPVKVVASSFGIFTRRLSAEETGLDSEVPVAALVQNLAADGRAFLNSPSAPAVPGGTIILWGTGRGRQADAAETATTKPPDIQVEIGGRSAEIESAELAPCCPGVDRIRLRVPEQVPIGCSVPVWVRLRGAVYSNVETLSISEDGSRCNDLQPHNLPAGPQAAGLATLSRSLVDEGFLDEAWAGFGPSAGSLGRLPAPGSCLPGLPRSEPEVSPELDAGPELSLTTPGGAILLPGGPPGEPPLYRVTSPPVPPFLGPGEYTLGGVGGADVGAFSASIRIPSPPIWAAPAPSEIVLRNHGLDISWGAAEGSEIRLTLSGGWGLNCRGAGATASLTLPAALLTNLLASASLPRGSERLEFSATFAPIASGFTADGIDEGRLRSVHRDMRDVLLSPLELPSTPLTLPNGTVIQAEMAAGFSERRRGLMGRPALAADRGMLFLFERPGRLTFWMSGVLIPLDILWLDSNRRIVGLSERMPPCESAGAANCPLVDGGSESQFVLELPADTVEANGLSLGDSIRW